MKEIIILEDINFVWNLTDMDKAIELWSKKVSLNEISEELKRRIKKSSIREGAKHN